MGGNVGERRAAQLELIEQLALIDGGIAHVLELIGGERGSGGDDLVRLPGLELDCIGTGLCGGVDERLGEVQVAVVVHARLCDDQARMSRPDPPAADLYPGRAHHGSMVVRPSTGGIAT